MPDQDDGSIANPEVDLGMRSDVQVLAYPRRYGHLTFGSNFHGITVACITLLVKSSPSAFSNSHYDQGGGIQIEIAIEIGIEILCLFSILTCPA
jgi:hypothetical protein